ncbi:CRISPR-associated protein Csn2-St [Streptococcus sp.]|uniref:CRISPR-associated protein Csn2-St n=1 Tax=Streptococcus sp. TaxID=1306 RepID=UPI00391B41CE
MWQLLIWYFNGKKYSEEDLNIFNQTEPEISIETGSAEKKLWYHSISMSRFIRADGI